MDDFEKEILAKIDPVIDEIKDVYIDNSFGRYDIPY